MGKRKLFVIRVVQEDLILAESLGEAARMAKQVVRCNYESQPMYDHMEISARECPPGYMPKGHSESSCIFSNNFKEIVTLEEALKETNNEETD